MAMGCELGWRGGRGKVRESRREEIGRRGKEEGGGSEWGRRECNERDITETTRQCDMHERGPFAVLTAHHSL